MHRGCSLRCTGVAAPDAKGLQPPMHRGCSLRCTGVAASRIKGLQRAMQWVVASDGRGSSGRGVLSAAKSHASHKGWWCMGGSAGHEAGARSQLARVRVRARVRVSALTHDALKK